MDPTTQIALELSKTVLRTIKKNDQYLYAMIVLVSVGGFALLLSFLLITPGVFLPETLQVKLPQRF